jgi:hypothetical protein
LLTTVDTGTSMRGLLRNSFHSHPAETIRTTMPPMSVKKCAVPRRRGGCEAGGLACGVVSFGGIGGLANGEVGGVSKVIAPVV